MGILWGSYGHYRMYSHQSTKLCSTPHTVYLGECLPAVLKAPVCVHEVDVFERKGEGVALLRWTCSPICSSLSRADGETVYSEYITLNSLGPIKTAYP